MKWRLKDKPGFILAACVAILLVSWVFSGVSITASKQTDETPIEGPSFGDTLEYNRHLKRAVISLSLKDTSLDLHDRLLLSLPEYTIIIMLLPGENLPAIAIELQDKSYGGRTILVPFNITRSENSRTYLFFPDKETLLYGDSDQELPSQFGTVWAQDLFEVLVKENGNQRIMMSDAHKWFTSIDGDPLTIAGDNGYIAGLTGIGIEVNRSKLVFSGGNILVDEIDGEKLVFSGGDVLRKTAAVWTALGDADTSESRIIDFIKVSMDADRVIIIGGDKVQPEALFHLDQAMVFLSDAAVAVTKVTGENPDNPAEFEEIRAVKAFLQELRSILLELGYTIIDLETSVGNILNYQYYANAIPFVNDETGEKTLLMPVFPGSPDSPALVRKNQAAYESAGYRVIPVESRAYESNGGIHCLINVLE